MDTMEYCQAVKIRDNATSAGKELKSNCIAGNRERANLAFMGYMRRIETVADTHGGNKGVLIEWGEVRIAERCA